jgi:hypothetical protein
MPTEPEARLETPPRLLAQARERMRTRHLALRTEQAYLQWLERYVAFHHGRHPRTLGAPEVEQFLTHLAVHRKVSAATQNQALLFIYRHVLDIELPRLTMLPTALENSVHAHLERLRGWYEEERRRARPGVSLPFALARKYPEAGTRWG